MRRSCFLRVSCVVLLFGGAAIAAEPEPQQTIAAHPKGVSAVAFMDGGKTLVSSGLDRTVKQWDVKTGKALRTHDNYHREVQSLAITPDGKGFATGTSVPGDRREYVAEVRLLGSTEADRRTLAVPQWWPDQAKDGSTDRHVNCLAFSPDGKSLAAGIGRYGMMINGPAEVRIWDVRSGKEQFCLAGHDRGVRCVAFSPDGKVLASASGDEIKLWDAKKGEELLALHGKKLESVQSIAFSPDGKMLASGDSSGLLILWDVAARKQRHTVRLGDRPGTYIETVTFLPGGEVIIAGHGKTVTFISAATGKAVRSFEQPATAPLLAVSPDGKTLVTGDDKGTIRLWDVPALSDNKPR